MHGLLVDGALLIFLIGVDGQATVPLPFTSNKPATAPTVATFQVPLHLPPAQGVVVTGHVWLPNIT